MNSYIKGIVLFKDDSIEGKRILQLSRGLNIIAGHSKTGKSAVIDIIDWCLFANECKIPDGKITEFTKLYVLLIELNEKSVLLARKDEYEGKNDIFINEVPNNLKLEEIQLSDILEPTFISLKDGLEKINKIIDLIINPNDLPFDDEKKKPKTDIRSTLAFIFQDQHTVSSKKELFCYEPEPKHFPVLAGWFGAEYYSLLDRIDRLSKKIKEQSNKKKDAIKNNLEFEKRLKNTLRTYYNLIGIDYNDNWTIQTCLDRIKNLENYSNQEYSNNLLITQEEIEKLINKNIAEKLIAERTILKLTDHMQHGNDYKTMLELYNERVSFFEFQKENSCPICGRDNEELTIEAIEILEADKWLKNELQTIPVHTSKFETEIKELKIRFDNLSEKIKELKKEFNANKDVLDKIGIEQTLDKEKQRAKYNVEFEMENYTKNVIELDEKEFDRLQSDLDRCQEKRMTYNESEKYESEKKVVEKEINRIINKLDFEHRPTDLHFELNPNKKDDLYKLYHNSVGNRRIFLSKMGSSSNYLACHISLFLAFLNYFSHQIKSKVPSILFFDQPSQVYFPSGKDNTDVQKVGQIYQTILDEIELIKNETGITVQIIIADHIKDLGEETVNLYEHYFKADWREGNGLI